MDRDRQDKQQTIPIKLESQLKLAQECLSDLAWELEDLELRLQTLEADQAEGGMPDPLVGREIEHLRQRRARQEELVLGQMLKVDDLQALIGRQRSARAGSEVA